MTQHQQNIKNFMSKIPSQIVREKPTAIITVAERKLRAKLILEEAFELIKAMGIVIGPVDELRDSDELSSIDQLNFYLSEVSDPDLVEIADAIADLSYVSEGTACSFGIDMEPIHAEVHRSNMSKFDGGVINLDGKLVKGKGWSAPDIKKLLIKQGAEGL